MGGTNPYNYLWSNGLTSSTPTGLAAGAYSVVVTDANGCAASADITITEPASALSGSLSSQINVSTFGGDDGQITVAGSGGTFPYHYQLESGSYQSSGTFGNLSAGTYNITVQDANLCTFSMAVTITQLANCGTVTDVDGNVYNTVTIGTQCWLQENLKTTKYKDGTSIPLVTDNSAWGSLSTPGYCWYNNDDTYKNTYGALYNYYTVLTNNLCPSGWHVATEREWSTLVTYLGGASIAGGKLKESGTTHWVTPNTGANNETGFIALPGGRREHPSGALIYLWVYLVFFGHHRIIEVC